jgi:hypothetical protein
MITAQDLAAGDNHRPTTLVAGGAVLLGDPVPTSALDRHLAGLIDGYGIPPETASRLPLSGTARQVAQHMAAFAEAGAQHLVLGPIADVEWREQSELLATACRLLAGGRVTSV